MLEYRHILYRGQLSGDKRMTNGISTKKYGLTLTACYVGYVIQAIVNNLSPLLFVQFGKQFGVSQSQLSILIFVNFGLQILVDAVSPKIVEKIGYRAGAIIAQTFSAVGLICLGSLPFIMPSYAGIIIAALLMAVGGGFVEVIISPVVEALPLGNKSGAMCFLHSFYCWGHIITVLVATLYFNCFGIGNWQWLPIALSVIPVLNCIIFARCPIETLDGDENPSTYKSIFTAKGFIVFPVLMLAAGAAEQSIAQWASAFAEKGLGVNKTMGDILGTCLFAFFMAISRTVYGILGDKINLGKAIFACGVLLTGAYLLTAFSPSAYLSLAGIALAGLFVGLLWPGAYSLAGKHFPQGGTKMFGMLALFGDVGCTLGPTLTGLVSEEITVVVCSFVFLIMRKREKTKTLSK